MDKDRRDRVSLFIKKSMKIFITGIAGFLGSHLAEHFLAEGHEVVGVDNLIGGYVENVPKEAEFIATDCSNLNLMRQMMKGSDVVYHCACTAYEGLSVFSPYLVTDNTSGITAATLSVAIDCKVKRFVYCSSMARYGEQQVPFTEDMETKPRDPYGIAKVASEQLVRVLCDMHNIPWVIAVPHNIIGPKQKYDDPYRNVASIMVNMMLQGRQPVIYGDGEQKRCFSFIGDVIRPLAKMAVAPVTSEIINIGPDEEFISINELAQTIAEVIGFDLKPTYYQDRPLEVKLATCSSDKARKLLDYNTTTSLKAGLGSIVDYIKARGVRPFVYHLPLEIINEKTPKTWSEKIF